MTTTVNRYEVPVDGLVHQVALQGKVLHVAARWAWVVEFWALADSLVPQETRHFQAIPTGLGEVPEGAEYQGTAIAPDGLVWHLFELPGGGR